MKSIREAAMSKEETKENTSLSLWPKTKQSSYLDQFDDIDDPYNSNSYSSKSNTPRNLDIITISMNFRYEDLEITGEEEDPNAIINAENKAITAAYDKVEALLGKNFESRYSISTEAIDEYDSYYVSIILTPNL